MTITYAELDAPMESKDNRIAGLEIELEVERKVSAAMQQQVEAATGPAHTNTMTFDMTDKDGIDAFEYARLGKASHEVLWALWNEMCKHQDDYRGPDQITQQWIQRLNELMDYHYVPLEIK